MQVNLTFFHNRSLILLLDRDVMPFGIHGEIGLGNGELRLAPPSWAAQGTKASRKLEIRSFRRDSRANRSATARILRGAGASPRRVRT